MYVARFDRESIFWRVTVFEKTWSQEMLTNEVKEIRSKRFIFHQRAYRWIEKEICRSLFYNHRLEIING